MRTEDGHIVQECLNGEPGAFGMLVDKYKEGIYAFAYDKLRNFQDAEDVTQEVFLQAYRSLRTLRRWESLAFWLYRIAYARCSDLLRIRSRRVDRDFMEDQDPEAIDAPSLDSYRRDQLNQSIRGALDSLPDAYREVLVLHYFGGMTIKDMARSLGASPVAIGKRLSRGRSQLKEDMIAMINTAFEGQKLSAGFTFRIVEGIKRIKIQPTPRITGLPWGISMATGLIIAVLGLGTHINVNNMDYASISSPIGAPKVLKVSEITVDVMKLSDVTVISTQQLSGDGFGNVISSPQNAIFMNPQAGDTWTKKADMPGTRAWHSAGVVNGKIYVIGGWDLGNKNTTVEEYDPAGDKWTKKANIPTGRTEFTTSIVNGKIYAIGGRDASGNLAPISTVEEYDPVTDKWTKKANMPTARSHLSSCALNGKIYAICGLIMGNPIKQLLALEEYDPAEDRWIKKNNVPAEMTYCFTSVAINGRLYAITTNFDSGLTMVHEYDPSADKWLKKIDKSATRRWLAASVVNGRIYVIGGGELGNNEAVSTLEEYDPIANKWTKKADMPTARYWHSVSAVNGKIYAIGGVTGVDANNFYIITPAVEEYDAGFTGERVEPEGKLPTTWGDVRTASSK